MARVFAERMTAEIDGDFVVFLIGMRINRPWKVHKWLPVALEMPRMLRELAAQPDIGCLGVQRSGSVFIQYWRSFEHLERYARNAGQAHLPAWKRFNQRVRASSGDVGIWHETFLVRAGEYEAIYGAMPRIGLAAAGRHLPVGRRDAARERLGGSTSR